MRLEELNVPKNKIEILRKKGISTVESLLYSEPKKYLYFNEIYSLELTPKLREKIDNRIPVAIVGTCERVENVFKNNKSLIKIRIKEKQTEKTLFINIIGEYKKLNYYRAFIELEVIVGGCLQYSPEYHSFSMLNPVLFSGNIAKNNRIIPVYRKYAGISEDYYRELIIKAIQTKGDLDYIPQWVIQKYGLLPYKNAVLSLHQPTCEEDITNARKRIVFDDLLYFASNLEEVSKNTRKESPYEIKKTVYLEDMIKSLPFQLTNGQRNAITDMVNKAKNGEKISALVQGDVGSGKTIVALSLMLALAENGYQAVLMAPTAVLARQHYLELREKTEKYGFKSVLLTNELKPSEKKKVLAQIKEGECQFIVGTHSCISASVEYKNLAITITDEEHKFGVLQRQALIEKSGQGVHSVIMSGTPIPRTLANTLYGNSTEVYSMELPGNRKPIQTAICSSDNTIFNFLLKEIGKGRQCYVVCPLIDKADEESKMSGVSSIEETAIKYKNFFECRGIKVAVVTGKTTKEEQANILEAFKKNETHILMATTVIEVGVNVPNATVMVITGAERFGLATLHQLRGRVGRGEYQSYCILQRTPEAKESANLEILCKETDGLEIAKADLKHRGSGNIIGNEQSGNNKYIDLMLTYPKMFEVIKKIARELCKNNTGKDIIEIYEQYY